MISGSLYPSSFFSFSNPYTPNASKKNSRTQNTTSNNVKMQSDSDSDSSRTRYELEESKKIISESSSCGSRLCSCGRRRFLETVGTALFPIYHSNAMDLHPDDAMVAEALPLSDASVDAVVGTLVLCSVKDVDTTLQEVRRVLKPGGLYVFVEHVAAQDGTFLRFIQCVLDPLQQTVSDGCHLTRKTGNNISAAGFTSVDINTAFLSTASPIFPHVYGIACK